MIRNIIFDWSGTLVDDLPAVWQATNFVFRKAGINELTLDQFRAEFCLPFTRFYARYTPDIPLGQLEDWFHSHYRQCQDAVCELPHARDFLLFCRERGLRTFLLSTIHSEHFAVQSATTGFAQFLDRPYVQILDKRERIHEILAENGLNPRETLFIGDMQHDIETAQHGGVLSCGVLTGYNNLRQLRTAGPDLIVEHLGELRGILTRARMELGTGVGDPDQDSRFPVSTVGGLIFGEPDRVLMIRTHKWSDLWGIPGGKIRFGEPALEALKREIKEETGLEVGRVEFVLAQDCIHSTEFYRDAHFVLLNYTCVVTRPNQTVRLNEEAEEYRWVRLHEAMQMPLNTPTRRLIEAVLSRLEPRVPESV